jgi:hypothetical protein
MHRTSCPNANMNFTNRVWLWASCALPASVKTFHYRTISHLLSVQFSGPVQDQRAVAVPASLRSNRTSAVSDLSKLRLNDSARSSFRVRRVHRYHPSWSAVSIISVSTTVAPFGHHCDTFMVLIFLVDFAQLFLPVMECL